MRKIKALRSITLFLFAITGCHSSNDALTVHYGQLSGRVQIYQSQFSSFPSEGISVVLDSGVAQTVTDTNGYWNLDHVPIGTHYITASKPGFGLMRMYSIQVTPDGLTWVPAISYWNLALFAVPASIPHLDSVQVQTYPSQGPEADVLNVYSTSDSNYGTVTFVDTTADVLPADAHLFTGGNYGGAFYWIQLMVIHSLGIQSGTTLYVSTCTANSGDGQSSAAGQYYDPIHDRWRLVSTGPKSNVISFKMP